jgi:hypothetical protein
MEPDSLAYLAITQLHGRYADIATRRAWAYTRRAFQVLATRTSPARAPDRLAPLGQSESRKASSAAFTWSGASC